MNIIELQKEINKLQQENLRVEAELNILYEEQKDIKDKAKANDFNRTAKERRISEIKRSVYNLSVELDKKKILRNYQILNT